MLLLLSLWACTTPSHEVDDPRPNIVVVVLDTTRADRLSANGYGHQTTPYLEQMAAQGTRFSRAWSTSSWTLPSHASLFTGLTPDRHGADQETQQLALDARTLAEVLGESGYQTFGVSNNPWVTESNGLSQGFEVFNDVWALPRQRLRRRLGFDPNVQSVRRWMRREMDDARPFFVFINLINPHLPYVPDANHGEPFFASADAFDEASRRHPSAVRLIAQHYRGAKPFPPAFFDQLGRLYDGEIRGMDALVEQMVEPLVDARGPAETLVIVTSDHGEHLGEHGHVAHLFSLYEELVRIPMLARGPGFSAGTVQSNPASILDVHATVLAAAGLPSTESQGLDLRQPLPEDRILRLSLAWPRQSLDSLPVHVKESEPFQKHIRSQRAAVGRGYKLLRVYGEPDQYFNLLADPGEQQILSTTYVPEDIAAALQAAVGVPAGPREAVESAPIDAEREEQLRKLGYLE
ncbi:MAG: sulfatase [Myxococcota bacterium]